LKLQNPKLKYPKHEVNEEKQPSRVAVGLSIPESVKIIRKFVGVYKPKYE